MTITTTWTGMGAGTWNDPDDWSAGVPTSGEVAQIDLATVTVSDNAAPHCR